MRTCPEAAKDLQYCRFFLRTEDMSATELVPGTRSRSEVSAPIERPLQVSRCARPVGILGLPVVSELRDSSFLARRHEDRVVAEPLVPARLLCDAAFENAGAAQLLAVRREGDQLADVAGATAVAFDRFELFEQAP